MNKLEEFTLPDFKLTIKLRKDTGIGINQIDRQTNRIEQRVQK